MMFNFFKKISLHKTRLIFAGVLVGQSLLMVIPASAQQAVIDERKEGFKAMGAAMKGLNGELKNEKPDAARMLAAAEKLATLSQKIPGWFPEGSGRDSGKDTDALPYIWKNKEKFSQLSDALIVQSKAMVPLTSSSDIAAIKKQLLVIKDTCSSCHESYRAD
jgi:cytochrome c556